MDIYEIRVLQADLLMSNITDATGRSFPRPPVYNITFGGSWGVPSMPSVFSAIAINSGKESGFVRVSASRSVMRCAVLCGPVLCCAVRF